MRSAENRKLELPLMLDRTGGPQGRTGMGNKVLGFPRSPVTPTRLNGSSDHEFRGQDAPAEGHSRVMQPLEKHLHASFADLFFVDADGRKRRVHQNGLITVVETHQADIVRHFNRLPLQRSPEPVSYFVVGGYGGSGSRVSGQDSSYALLAEIDKTLCVSDRDQDGF